MLHVLISFVKVFGVWIIFQYLYEWNWTNLKPFPKYALFFVPLSSDFLGFSVLIFSKAGAGFIGLRAVTEMGSEAVNNLMYAPNLTSIYRLRCAHCCRVQQLGNRQDYRQRADTQPCPGYDSSVHHDTHPAGQFAHVLLCAGLRDSNTGEEVIGIHILSTVFSFELFFHIKVFGKITKTA